MITKERGQHMLGVAQYMYQHAHEYGLPAEDMYILGLLHDVGYLHGGDTHGLVGKRMLFDFGFRGDKFLPYSYAIEHHGEIPDESLPESIRKVCILLNTADMMIDCEGNEVGFDKRLRDIGFRYGQGSEIYKTASDLVMWLSK